MTDTSRLTSEETARYLQQLKLSNIGLQGQQKLKNARVLCVGAGGLGSSLLLYLAGAGVGTIGIIDSDFVELANLSRQILYQTEHVGQGKVHVAKQQLRALNPNVEIDTYDFRFELSNAKELVDKYDIIADCSDNFQTRYLINDTCCLLGKPYVFASISEFEGQCCFFLGYGGPCYRCLFPNFPDHSIPNCTQGGVVGVLPGLLGIIQATEILKWLLQDGKILTNRLLLINVMEMRFREVQLRQNPDCISCVKKEKIANLHRSEGCSDLISGMSPRELRELLESDGDFILVDVRSRQEHSQENIGGMLIPLPELAYRLNELDKTKMIVVYCHSGMRSIQAAGILIRNQFESVKYLVGGMTGWN
jgi:sulfur-carrier protein adenylyltransferase/sulfurtransferase